MNLERGNESLYLWQNATLEAGHVEEQIRIVFRVNRNECILPLDGGHGARQTIFDVPEDSTTSAKIEKWR